MPVTPGKNDSGSHDRTGEATPTGFVAARLNMVPRKTRSKHTVLRKHKPLKLPIKKESIVCSLLTRIGMKNDEVSNPWKTLSQAEKYDNKWINVTEYQVINPGGGRGIYGKVHFKNRAVGV